MIRYNAVRIVHYSKDKIECCVVESKRKIVEHLRYTNNKEVEYIASCCICGLCKKNQDIWKFSKFVTG